jgi:hypothetical protein
LQQAVIQRQGLITKQGYEEQAQSYLNMESAADMAASAEKSRRFSFSIELGIRGAGILARERFILDSGEGAADRGGASGP